MCARCEELEEEVAYLKGELGLQREADEIEAIRSLMPRGDGLGRRQSANLILALYRARGRTISHDQIAEIVPAVRSADRNDAHITKVLICHARKGVGRDGIRTAWGVGYALTDAGRARVAAVLGEAA